VTHKTTILEGAVVVPVKDPRVSLPERGLQSRGEFHITLLTPPEGVEMMEGVGWSLVEFEEKMTGLEIRGEPEYVCLGKQEEGSNAVYYIVVRWRAAQYWLAKLGLAPKDLHVTLGFRESDIYEAKKGVETCIRKLGKKK
jgi:hypothetical protein